jgi:hypothetical protein
MTSLALTDSGNPPESRGGLFDSFDFRDYDWDRIAGSLVLVVFRFLADARRTVIIGQLEGSAWLS